MQPRLNGRMVTLPADYSNLRRARLRHTVHTAQGVTADTMHGVVTGEESRQQLYTMLTRGRSANHVYVAVVGDGDPHTVIQPDNVHLRTATELLEQILARDATAIGHHPAARAAGSRRPARRRRRTLHRRPYLSPPKKSSVRVPQALTEALRTSWCGLTDEPAWPTCVPTCSSLPSTARPAATAACRIRRQRVSATDRAAVLDWRLHDTSLLSGEGPLPWLPGIPDRIAANPDGGHTCTPDHLVAQLADQVRSNAEGEAPAWAQRHAHVPAELIADMHVWRAANQIDPATYDQPGHPNTAEPLKPGNSNSTSGSPPRTPVQNGDGGNCSPQKLPRRPRTHSCRS